MAALGAEVQVVAGQAAVALAGAGEVGVHPAGRGPHVGGRAAGQVRALEPGEGGVAVSCGAVLVDVQDVWSGGAGGDGQVPAEAAAEPLDDLPSSACSAYRSASCGNLDLLVVACAADRRWSFLLAAAPLSVVGGVGSFANAIALR